MATGVTNTLKVMDDIQKLLLDTILLLKAGPPSLLSIGKVLTVLKDVQQLVQDAPGAFPELASLDGAEIGQLTSQSYDLVKEVLASLATISSKNTPVVAS